MQKLIFVITILVLSSLACRMTAPAAPPPTLAPDTVVLPVIQTPETASQAAPAHIQLNGVTLEVQEAVIDHCDQPETAPSAPGKRYLSVRLQALDLPAGNSLDYKRLPGGIAVTDDTGTVTPFERILAYIPSQQRLTLCFAVPEDAAAFSLLWPGVEKIPLKVSAGR